MRKLFLLLAVLPVFFMSFTITPPEKGATQIKWYTWEEMVEAQATNPKPIFVDVYTDWCGWCKRLDRSTFQDPKVIQYLSENFYPVKLDGEYKETIRYAKRDFKFIKNGRRGYHELAASLMDNRLSYPTTITLNASFERVMLSPGFKDADKLLKELKFTAEEAYKKQTWQAYSTVE